MQQYLFHRLLLMVPTLVGLTILVSLLVRLLPGDTVELLSANYSGSDIEGFKSRVRRELGLDEPAWRQYLNWTGAVLQGDFGNSLYSNRPIGQELKRRLPASTELGLLALIVSVGLGVSIGVLSAVTQDSWADYLLRGGAILFLSIPVFWVGTLVLVAGTIWFSWAPPARYVPFWEDPRANLGLLWIPALILGIGGSASLARITRTAMLDALRQDYVRTAAAKGLPNSRIVLRHAFRNALIPVVTYISLYVPLLIAGAVVLETIFSIPGTGSYLVFSVNTRDYPAIQAINLLVGLTVILANFAVDLAYSLLDPRVSMR
jgi:peptide/nickel transport system permease protein